MTNLGYLFKPSPAISKGMEKSVYWSSFNISKEGECKVPYTFLVRVQSNGPNQCCGPHWVVVRVLSIHLHSQLEADSREGYGIEYGYHLPTERAWT